MDLEETDDERFSQEIGVCVASFQSHDENGDTFVGLNDSDDLPPFISTPSTTSVVKEKPRKTAFKRGDFAWAKHKESWWPAVIKNVYKARRCATVVWTDDCEEDRRKNLAKGFKVSLSSLRSWSCPERKYILSDGAKHGSKFETAVGMLDNFLMKTAQNEMSMDIFEYLSSIHGSLYSLLDRRCEVESESSNYSPDIKKLKMDPSRLRVNVSECGGEVKCDEENDKNDNNNDINTDLEDDNVEINGTTSRGLTSVRRNLQKDLTNDTNDETLTESSPILERMSGILSSLSSDGCRNYLRQIFDDKQKSLLKVLYEHRQRTLKAAKLNHFGPLKRDEDVDEVMSILKQYYLGFSTKESLTINDLEVVMQVYLPEALCFALNDVEGKSFNEAAREIWFGIKASNSAVSSLL